ncbi:glutamine synthetase family protein [Coriobacteriia bacterium Es71-Z0120]|uniref:glutamine synthetase family protein n=1 Tax=Parvivirga hydrogeniphila TaxID=2939460 RepID=UPI002260F8D1|nr:glutamine synthetase family protein [Parvivirga hydrogeniphila]MCL4078850.1 glutamine synthetase family protein [Parvivirga hydrogeniphila]
MTTRFDKDYVLKTVEERNIRFIRFWFTDVLGVLKSFAVTDSELEGAFEEGMGFDGSSIDGYTRIQESDMVAFPDASTFQLLPWRSGEVGVARMFADVRRPDGSPFEGDPRYALKRMLDKAASMGYTMYVGPELEFFYFKNDKGTEVLDQGGYFDLTPLDVASDLRRETVLTLEKLGIPVEYSHHEVAPSQHEIDLRYADALTMADNVMTYRLVVKEIAYQNGVYATFMPKPIEGQNGSGMHTHQSLFTKDGNAFYDPNDPQHLSKVARHYIAGLLKYAPEFCAVTNPLVNSYKRLVPGYEAPVYISWAQRNRSAMVRVPMYKPGKEAATRIELRSPDPSCNPYLAFAVMLGAGLKGIEEELELMPEATNDIFEMTEAELAEAGIETLPKNLGEAIERFEHSELMKEVLGEHIHAFYVENKKAEWADYIKNVSKWELDRYLSVV